MGKKSIFITGAASGIGLETARLFAKKEWYVGIFDVNEQGIKELEAEIGADNCFAAVLDVTVPEQVKDVMEEFAKNTGGTMDVMFNNAGVLKFDLFEDSDLDFNLKTVDVNLKGVITCTKSAIPYLKATPGSRLINMASTSAIYGIPDLSVYAATKHAVCALTEAWSMELQKYGIIVSDLLAPFVATPLIDTAEERFIKKSFGVKLESSNIAETVWKAAHGNKLHWWIGGTTYILFPLFWLMPFLKRPLLKKLTIQ